MSAGKGAVGYSFDNGAKAFVGKNGLGYDFGARKKLSFNPMNQELKYKSNNGAEVYQRPTDDGRPHMSPVM